MKDSKFEKLCETVDYNTYMKLQQSLGLSSSLSFLGFSIANNLIPQYPITDSIGVVNIILLSTYIRLSIPSGKQNTKDIKQIKQLYNEFLNNYNNLNKIFDLNNPVEIYTMFNYLLSKGYLSKDKVFDFSDEQTRNLKNLLGVEVITGKGVCRHVSGMLTDILNASGIKSESIGVYAKEYNMHLNIIDEQKYTKEELINWARENAKNEQDYERFKQIIEEFYNANIKNIEFSPSTNDATVLEKIFGNHAISFALKDEKSYFLDPTREMIYRMDKSKKILCDENGNNVSTRLIPSILLGNSKTYFEMRKKIFNPSISTLEEQAFIEKTLDKCKDNMDIFEQFYASNSELYDDISNKVLNIRR